MKLPLKFLLLVVLVIFTGLYIQSMRDRLMKKAYATTKEESMSDNQLSVYADMILYNGKIITVNKNFSTVDSVAIKDGKFIAVGKKKEVMQLSGDKTKRLDLEGKTVIPGLYDSHNHMMLTAVSFLLYVDLSNCKTMDEVLNAIEERAKSLGPGKWVITSGQWHESQLKENRLPHLKELDSVSPDNPVFVARGGHTVVINTKALELAGITKNTPNPPGGEFKKDPVTGEPTGLIFDKARQMVEKVLLPVTYEQCMDALRLVMKKYNRYGITAVIEPGFYPGDTGFKPYYDLWSKGEISVRTRILIAAFKPQDVIEASKYLYRGFGDDKLRVIGIKSLVDGGIETSYLKDPYEIVPGEQEKQNYHGIQVVPQETLKEICRAAAENRWQMQVHVGGDAAIESLVDTYAEIDQEFPNSIKDLRWTVMHIMLPTQKAIDTMKKHGMIATAQDHPTYLGANQVKYWGKKRGSYAIPLRKLLDEGILVGGGTDSLVVNFNPFLSLWWMITRNTITAGILGPDQAITREEALKLYTINSAYCGFDENILGSIEVGKLADLVVLDKDILTCPKDDIRYIRPLKTMVGGKFVFEEKQEHISHLEVHSNIASN